MNQRDVKLSEAERGVLQILCECYGDEQAAHFDELSQQTRLDRKEVRRACRSLKRKGLVEFHRGLMTEEGTVAGSGYSANRKTIADWLAGRALNGGKR